MAGNLVAVDDTEELEVAVRNKVPVKPEVYFDPFKEPVREFDGVGANLKRKATRMEKAYTGTGDAKSKQDEDVFVTGYTLLDVMEPAINQEYLATLYTKSSPHFAAVNAKVANFVGLGFDFVNSYKMRQKLDSTTDSDALDKLRAKIERARSQLFDLIDTFNAEDEFAEVLNKIFIDYEAIGNGYMEIGRQADGTIGYIGHIPAKTMRVRKQRDGFVQIINERVVFFRNYGDQTTSDPTGKDPQPNEIIHFKKYNPNDSFYGIPNIMAAMDAVLGDELASRYNLDYFDNKAVPRYVIVVKGGKQLSDASQQRILEFFETGLKGQNHRSLFVPLPPDDDENKYDFKMEPVEAGKQDSSFTTYDKTNLNKILMAERVPLSKIGLAEGVSLAVARDADKTFAEQVCRPEQKIIEKKIGRVMKEFTDMFYFKLSELKLSDEDTVSKIHERYLRWGAMTANDVRTEQGKPSVPWGDDQAFLATDPAALEAKAQSSAASQAKANAGQTRTRDSQRSAAATDSAGEGRNPKGEGRTT